MGFTLLTILLTLEGINLACVAGIRGDCEKMEKGLVVIHYLFVK